MPVIKLAACHHPKYGVVSSKARRVELAKNEMTEILEKFLMIISPFVQ